MPETKDQTEIKENQSHCCCSCGCCHCKRIFMLVIVLLLAFMAGIMVGSCRPCHYPNNYYSTAHASKHFNKIKKHKLHRGMHQVESTTNAPQQPNDAEMNTTPQIEGYIIEVD